MKTQAILAAGGIGTRLKSSLPKPLVLLKGKPILAYSLELFEKCSLIESVVVVASPHTLEDIDRIVRDSGFTKVSRIVEGGETRRMSVYNGLEALDKDTGFVVIHDGARPLLKKNLLEVAIRTCYDEAAVVVAVPLKPTIKKINPNNMYVTETVDRTVLWEIQTPQVFKKDLIVKAHKQIKDIQATDDAFLVEKLRSKVKVVKGDYENLKVTTKEDLAIAEYFLSAIGVAANA